MITYHVLNQKTIAEVKPGNAMGDLESLLDLMAEIRYNDSDSIILYSEDLPSGFFDLKTRIAGEILQKFSNYRMRLSIVGDFSDVKSKSLNDFMRESNRTGTINFVSSISEALTKLSK